MTQHKSLNTSKGVVRNWELARTDPDEIKENVPSILDVHRIIIKRNNMEVKTNTLILTFNSPKIPDSLKICYLNHPLLLSMFQIHYVVINVKGLVMLRVNASTMKRVPNARKLVTKMNHVPKHLNV